MALKPQDIAVICKLIAQKSSLEWSQNSLAVEMCLSPSQVNSAFKRLVESSLVTPYRPPNKPRPILQSCKNFFTHGVAYAFPAQQGELVRGMPTSYAAPCLKQHIAQGDEPIPVWPYAKGKARGLAIKPLYPALPKALDKFPDQPFYDLLALIDAIRTGKAREKNIAIELLSALLSE
ncbi:MAG: hypothetical protein CMF50_03000 [Legionellales bacterium]|nr:hypothetical protein [Legionellales bacterium]|tara:strand:+ start:29886 stop:30416 length:531 start_codon:yes stop_codon:yes gene_type:complete